MSYLAAIQIFILLDDFLFPFEFIIIVRDRHLRTQRIELNSNISYSVFAETSSCILKKKKKEVKNTKQIKDQTSTRAFFCGWEKRKLVFNLHLKSENYS